jgi:putative membrane protein
MKHGHDYAPLISPIWEIVFIVLAGLAIGAYLFAIKTSEQKVHLKRWPRQRIVYWVSGILSALVVMAGPLAETVHTSFTMHMFGHLLLGMLSPLLLVLASPMKLLLRALPVSYARGLTKFMRSNYIRFVTHPITASVKNIGGLWILYTTNLFQLMHEFTWVFLLVHLHVFLAGYVFTAAMIYIDPVAHRFSYRFRSIVFILALAGHQILSKYIYAYPPTGVGREQAKAGGMLMYYGGNMVDVIIIYLICLHWYRSVEPRSVIYEKS